jgi:hypothetical protein
MAAGAIQLSRILEIALFRFRLLQIDSDANINDRKTRSFDTSEVDVVYEIAFNNEDFFGESE